MLIAIWHKWIEQRQWWWLILLGSVVLVDALIGSWLITQELHILKEVMR